MLELLAGSEDTCTGKDTEVGGDVRLEAATLLVLEVEPPLLVEEGDPLEVLLPLGIATGAGKPGPGETVMCRFESG